MPKLRILVVEDDIPLTTYIQDVLRSIGHDVAGAARSGEEAVQLCGQIRPDLVLMDLVLAGAMDGVTATEHIQNLMRVPVVFLTAYQDESTFERVAATKASGFVVKPFEETQLRAAVEIAYHKHRHESGQERKQHWLSSTFECLLDGVISTDEKGIIRMMNSTAETLTRWKKEDAYGKTLTEVFNVAMDSSDPVNMIDSLNGSSIIKAAREQTVLTAKDGATIPVEYSSAMVRDQLKNLEGFVLIFRNVTARRRLEEALNQSRRRYKELINTIDGIVWEADTRTGRFSFVSKQAERILGYPVSRWMNERRFWVDHLHPQDRNTVLAIRSNRIEAKRDYECEYRMMAADGRIVWMRDMIRLVEEENGNLKLRGVMLNITVRKWAEDSLRESEERFRSAFEYTTVGMALVRPDGRFMRVNQALCDILGYTAPELLSATINTITHPDDAAASADHFDKMMKGELISCQCEMRYMHKSGNIVWVLLSSSLIRNSENKPLYFISQVEDVTERKLAMQTLQNANDELERRVAARTEELSIANKALKSSEEKYRTLFEESNEVIFISTTEGKLVDINPAGIRLFGYSSKEEMLELDIARDLYADKTDRERFVNTINHHGSVKDFELAVRRSNGDRIYVTVTATASRQEGKIAYYRGIMRDVTQLKILEDELRQAQKMEAIGLLAGGVAHDFNNTLMAITGYCEILLMRMDESDPLRAEVEEIGKAANRGASLTRQLLAFSRKQVLKPELLNLNKVLLGMKNMLQRLIGEHIELVLLFDDTLGTVKADPGQIEQVILNLSVNARDAMPAGGMLTLQTANVDLMQGLGQQPPGSYVLLTVTDSGAGMDSEMLARIFEPFFTTKEKGKGTGLGLATVYGIVKQSGAFIWVYSEVGQGTTFKVYFPRIRADARSDERAVSNVFFNSGSETILLVDDNESVLHSLTALLEMQGYKVLPAVDPSQAQEIAEKFSEPIHLLITDVVMPQMSGRELASTLTQSRPELKTLLISGYDEQAIKGNGENPKSLSFLSKPVSMNLLLKTIRDLLEQKSGGQ